MELSQLNLRENANKGFAFKPKHPVIGETDLEITVLGSDSDAYRAASVELQRKVKDVEKPTEDQATAWGAELIASIVTGWKGITSDGEPVPFSPEKAAELFSDTGFDWLVLEIRRAIEDRANFTKAPPSA